MPIVPRPQRRVGSAPLPGARVPTGGDPAAFQPRARVDVSGAADVLSGVIQRAQQDARQVQLQDADNARAALESRLLSDVGEAQGLSALEAAHRAQEAWEQGVGEIEQGIGNEAVRQAFRRVADQRRVALGAEVGRHVDRELRAHDDQSTEAGLKNDQNDALRNYADPDLRSHALATGEARLTDYARRKGWSPEARETALREWRSGAHVGVLNRMLSAGDDRGAAAYYAGVRDQVSGQDAARVEKALETGRVQNEGQRRADGIVRGAGAAEDRGAALERVAEIEDVDVRDETRKRVNEHFDDRRRAEAERYDGVLDSAMRYVAEGRRPAAPLWAELKGRDRVAIESLLERERKGEGAETDWNYYYDVMQKLGDPALRGDALRTSAAELRAKLSDQDFRHVVGVIASLRDGKADGEHQVRGFLTTAQVVDDAMKNTLKWNVKAKTGDQAKRVSLFRAEVNAEIEQEERATGKRPSPERVREMVDRLVVRGEDDRRTPAESLALPPEDVRDIRDVPQVEAQAIREALARQRRTISNEMIMQVYRLKLARLQRAPAGLR